MANAENGILPTPSERQESERRDEVVRERKRRKLQTIFNAIVASTGALTIAVLIYQSLVMSRTLEQIAMQTRTAEISATAAERAANSAEKAANIAAATLEGSSEDARSARRHSRQQIQEARTATEQARRALELSERPWLGAQKLDVTADYPPGDSRPNLYFEVRVAIKNNGKSVANETWVRANVETIFSENLRATWQQSCRQINADKAALEQQKIKGSGETWPHGFAVAPGDTIEQDLEGMGVDAHTLDKGRFWVLGCAEYLDQFGKEHHTNFCFEPISPFENLSFKRCPKFEQAD